MADQDDKTEEPTARRLDEARKQGQFPVSREFVSGIVFLIFVWMLQQRAVSSVDAMSTALRAMLEQAFASQFTVQEATRKLTWVSQRVLAPIATAGLLIAALALAVQLGVTRMGLAWNRLRPDFSRLSPLSRLRQIGSENVSGLGRSLLAIPLFGWLLYSSVREQSSMYLALTRLHVRAGAAEAAQMLASLLWRLAFVFLLVGLLDLFRQRSRWAKQLKMSKQEIRDEHKTSEGNPMIKMRIRRIQRDALRRRMMQQVPKATAVIVNPTHYAVAIRYQVGQPSAPKVVAKGKNWLALRIRETAIRNQVPIVENPPLAQALYGSVDVGQEVPPHLYQAVAEVLAYIYRLLKGRLPGSDS